MQVIMLDIEHASAATSDTETLKLLNHAFEACQDMALNIPDRISKEAPHFTPAPATAESKPNL